MRRTLTCVTIGTRGARVHYSIAWDRRVRVINTIGNIMFSNGEIQILALGQPLENLRWYLAD